MRWGYYTKAQVRRAILRAADRIEKHEDQFKFASIIIPRLHSCRDTGCALGWIAAYLHYIPDPAPLARTEFGESFGDVSRIIGNVTGREDYNDMDFYQDMNKLCPDGRGGNEHNWEKYPKVAARVLRKYVKEYFDQ